MGNLLQRGASPSAAIDDEDEDELLSHRRFPSRDGKIGTGANDRVFVTRGTENLHKLHDEPPPTVKMYPPLDAEEEKAERARIREFFDRLDGDSDGLLNRTDLERELVRLDLPVSSVHLNKLMKIGGASGSGGKLDFDEFYRFCIRREQQLREIFDAVDQKRDGRLHPDEVEKSLVAQGFHVSEGEVQRMMDRMVKNENDAVTWREWREFLVLFPSSHVKDIFRYWHGVAVLGDEYIDFGERGYSWQAFVSGAVAGMVSRTCTAPFDRLKIMMMSQAAERKLGLVQAVKEMIREGGFRSLWRGNFVNVVKVTPESAIRFFVWEEAKKFLATPDGELKWHHRVAAGSIAGIASQSSIFPLEMIKTRLATGTTGQYHSIGHCVRTIIKAEGIRAFYKGLTPSLLGIIPYAGIDLGIYESLRMRYERQHPGCEPSNLHVLMCGTVSSTCGQFASYPLLLVRTRMQAKEGKTTMTHEFRSVVQSGGIFALYRGIGANVLKVGPAVGITYVIYERLKSFLGDKRP